MSVRVNLLPSEVRARGQANRARMGAVAAGVLLLVVLAGITLLQRNSIGDAEERLAAVEQQNAELEASISALQPFADLEARANDALAIVGLGLGPEGSPATVLQDLSAVFPPNAELTSLTITLPGEELSPAPGGDRLVFGRLAATGRVVDGVAPGVERLVIDLNRVAGFDNAYVTTTAVDDAGVATFTVEVDLGPEVLTGRYTTPEVAP